MKKIYIKFILVAAIVSACNPPQQEIKENEKIALGKWRGTLQLNENELPFLFEVKDTAENYYFEIINGNETIFVDEISFKGDSFIVRLPVFDSEIRGISKGEEILGNWYNNARKNNNIIPFKGIHALEKRFETNSKPNHNLTGKWEVGFFNPDENGGEFTVQKAIGEFTQTAEKITGTIITTTGDYRYLEGVVDGDEVKFSSFNGAHAFLFKARIIEDRLEGEFFSGLHWKEKWIAERNEDFTLPDADSLTYLKKGYSKIEFSFPDLNGNKVSLTDEKYLNKALIIQIMGSWCPNCYDESVFLSEIYKEYNDKGLEIIALAYETTTDPDKAKKNVLRMAKRAGAEYDFLLAGTSNKKIASETLPFLNHVMAFPTTIFIDKKGNVRKIHTGFTGPGTGAYYEVFSEKTISLINELIKE